MSGERYTEAFSAELAAIGRRVIAFAEVECAKTSKPCEAADISLVLQSAIIDHLEADYTRAAHPTRGKAEIAAEVAGMLSMIGDGLKEHAAKMLAKAKRGDA